MLKHPIYASLLATFGAIATALGILRDSGSTRNAVVIVLVALAVWTSWMAVHHYRLHREASGKLRQSEQEKNVLSGELAATRRELESTQAKWDSFAASGGGLVKYLRKERDLEEEAVSLLSACEGSLHYYGGTNLLSSGGGEWKDTLRRKIIDPDFSFERYIDLKPARELWGLYQQDSVDVAAEVEAYVSWLEGQCQEIRKHPQMNNIYDYPGAPIWQWGMHILIFDRKHILIAFNIDRGSRRGLLIRDQPAASSEMIEALHWVRNRLCVKPVSIEALTRLVEEGRSLLATGGPAISLPHLRLADPEPLQHHAS